MKKENIYIDLSKCSEEQRKYIFSLLPKGDYKIDMQIVKNYKHLHLCEIGWFVDIKPYGKTELTYPEFIKLFEGKGVTMTFGITAKNMEIINKQISRFEGAEFDRLSWEKIANEIGWDLPTIILWYFRKKESQNKWIKIESEADLPKDEKFWICTSDGRVLISSKAVLNWILKNENNKITHYQPLIKPEPPKF